MILEPILEAVVELFVEFLPRPAAVVLWWFVCYPLVYLLCAPFILLRAILHFPNCRMAMANMFRSITEYWRVHALYERYL